MGQRVMLQAQVLGQDEWHSHEAPQGCEEVLDPQEDAEIPWWAIQDAIGQVTVTVGILLHPILFLALSFSVKAEHTIAPHAVRGLAATACRVHGNQRQLSFCLPLSFHNLPKWLPTREQVGVLSHLTLSTL